MRKVLLPIESPQAVDIAELLADNLPSAFWRMILAHVVDEQNTAVGPTLVRPFLMPLQVWAVLASVAEYGVAALAYVWCRFLAKIGWPDIESLGSLYNLIRLLLGI